jgi:hypothetical protein
MARNVAVKRGHRRRWRGLAAIGSSTSTELPAELARYAAPIAVGITVVILTPMKTAISLPDDVYRAVEAQAKRLKLSRSEFFARAVVRLLEDLEDERVKTSYDEAFADEDSKETPFRRRAARAALLAVEWEDE